MPTRPRVLSLDPSTLGEVLGRRAHGSATRRPGRRGRRSCGPISSEPDLGRAGCTTRRAEPKSVAALEWLDPPYAGGHWVPEMIAAAGGLDALGTNPGERSRVISWDEVGEARPDVVVVMPCGLYASEAEAEARRHMRRLAALGAERVVAVDAASSFSRPGPRLADGIELLGHLLHPELVPEPGMLEWRPLARYALIPAPATTTAATKQATPSAASRPSSAGRVSRGEILRSAAMTSSAPARRRRARRGARRRDVGDRESDHEVEHQPEAELGDHLVHPAPAGDDDRRDEEPVDRTRGADGEGAGVAQQQRPGGAGDQRDEVDGDEASGADPRLQHLAEDVEDEHVQRQVDRSHGGTRR